MKKILVGILLFLPVNLAMAFPSPGTVKQEKSIYGEIFNANKEISKNKLEIDTLIQNMEGVSQEVDLIVKENSTKITRLNKLKQNLSVHVGDIAMENDLLKITQDVDALMSSVKNNENLYKSNENSIRKIDSDYEDIEREITLLYKQKLTPQQLDTKKTSLKIEQRNLLNEKIVVQREMKNTLQEKNKLNKQLLDNIKQQNSLIDKSTIMLKTEAIRNYPPIPSYPNETCVEKCQIGGCSFLCTRKEVVEVARKPLETKSNEESCEDCIESPGGSSRTISKTRTIEKCDDYGDCLGPCKSSERGAPVPGLFNPSQGSGCPTY